MVIEDVAQRWTERVATGWCVCLLVVGDYLKKARCCSRFAHDSGQQESRNACAQIGWCNAYKRHTHGATGSPAPASTSTRVVPPSSRRNKLSECTTSLYVYIICCFVCSSPSNPCKNPPNNTHEAPSTAYLISQDGELA